MEPVGELPAAAAAAATNAPEAAIGTQTRTLFVFITGADAGDQESVCFCTGERDWKNLLTELVTVVAEFALRSDVTDYIRLRAVCKPWRAAAEADPKLMRWDPRCFPRNWDILKGDVRRPDEGTRFVNSLTGASIRLQIPPEYGEVIGSAEGCLILVPDEECKCDENLRLFNPVTGAMALLPPLPCEAKVNGAGFVYNGEADADPTVVLCTEDDHEKTVVYAKPGTTDDDQWMVVGDDEDAELVTYSEDGLSVRGKFYVPTLTGEVRKLEMLPQPHLVYAARQDARHRWPDNNFAVASGLEPDVDDDGGGGIMLLRYVADNVELFRVNFAAGSLTLVEEQEDIDSHLRPWLALGSKVQ